MTPAAAFMAVIDHSNSVGPVGSWGETGRLGWGAGAGLSPRNQVVDHELVVVVVIGGIGSVKGAFIGALLIGLADTFGRLLVPEFASMTIYALMAGVLLWRPQGLFGRIVGDA